MPENDVKDIIKQAVLLEMRGRAFYRKTAEQAGDAAVKQFFNEMADDEEKHILMLTEQFKAYAKTGALLQKSYSPQQTDAASGVLKAEIQEKIGAAGFEAAAVSAAMSMEESAVEFYSQQADATDDANAKAMYQWLADWEKTHLAFLTDVDRSVRERIWFDNGFWPF